MDSDNICAMCSAIYIIAFKIGFYTYKCLTMEIAIHYCSSKGVITLSNL